METRSKVGERLSYDGALCTVRFVGEVAGTSGSWIGVEWDDGTRGKHDGSHKGKRYFSCKKGTLYPRTRLLLCLTDLTTGMSTSPTAASFVRPTRASEAPRSFIAAVKDKYTSDISAASAQIRFSTKVAEEVGFEKIRRRQADLAELKFAILDSTRIDDRVYERQDERINELCPKITELDLSRNLFTKVGTVVRICSELPGLRNLRLK
jgi:tubulin-specific chaperone E